MCRFDGDPVTRRLTTIRLDLRLPEDFPEKYRSAIVRVMGQCAVKKVMEDPPELDVLAEVVEPAGVG